MSLCYKSIADLWPKSKKQPTMCTRFYKIEYATHIRTSVENVVYFNPNSTLQKWLDLLTG